MQRTGEILGMPELHGKDLGSLREALKATSLAPIEIVLLMTTAERMERVG